MSDAPVVYRGGVIPSFRGYVSQNLAELWKYRYALYKFVGNTLRARYRRSVLGFLWTLLNPLINLTIIAVVFSMVYKADFKIFGRYLFSGLIPWGFMSTSIVGGCLSLANAEQYLKKVHLPKILFPVVSVSVELINFVLSLVCIYLISLFIGANFNVSSLLLPVVMLLTFFFNIGCAMIVSVGFVYLRDLSHIVQVAFGALFYLTPIVYYENLIPETYRFIFLLNPLYYFIRLFRAIIYELRLPTLMEWVPALLLAVLAVFVGLYLLRKADKDVVFRL